MQEIILSQVAKTLTGKRLWNVTKSLTSYLASALIRRPMVWGMPPVVTVEPTNLCNLKCPLCVTGNGTMRRAGGRMDLPTFQKLVDDIGDRIWYVIFFHQGEPYLNNAFLPSVAYAHARGLYTTTSSNAHYLDRENARRTVSAGLTSIIVSVDGSTQESYARYRVDGNLERVLGGIENLVAAKHDRRSKTPYILMQFLVMRHNEHEIAAMESLAKKLGVDRLLKKNIQVETREEAEIWMPHDEKYQRYRIEQEKITVRRGGKGICPRPWLSSLVNWDGSIVPCCFDKNGAHIMGHLDNGQQVTQIWISQQYQDFRKQMIEKRETIDICTNCNQGFGIWV